MRNRTLVMLVSALLLVVMSAPVRAGAASYEPPAWNPPAGQNVTTVRWGPITIPAMSGDKVGEIKNEIALDGNCNPLIDIITSCRSMKIAKPCENCYITGIMPDLVFAGTNTGVNMDTGGMLHHAVNVNFSRWDATCPPGLGDSINRLGLLQGGNERFFAAGNERTLNTLYSTGNNGYYVKAGDKWGLIYDLMNMTERPITVEFKYTFSWVPNATRVDPVWLDIDQCGDSERSIPAGYSDSHWITIAARAGTLVAVGGHAHDHSISVSLENATKNRYFCTSVAGYAPDSMDVPAGPGAGTDGHPASANTVTTDGHPNAPLMAYMGSVSDFSTCEPNLSFSLGDRIRVHTQYNEPAAYDSAMGIMVAFVRWR
ncbi:hypothetical protein ACQP2T_49845 [Nonomuraea sp. CA-143628]|uniref:hypothetical protein n=1 Tax=Nonomuraea sp. CA-143628 TaxID=3239997 RepID=UPI003D8C8522